MPLLATSTEELARVVGVEHVHSEPARLERCAVDGLRPAAIVEPGSSEEIAAVVRMARERGWKLLPVGGGTRLALGDIPEAVDVAVSLARLNRVTHYEPADLTVSVQAGAHLAEFERSLAPNRLFLPLDPPYAREGTLGGILATNATGPLRFAYGSARDFTLGLVYVTGEGRIARAGGRVVKNVAGYDLVKLLIGSFGTLGILTEIHFKLFPLPRRSASLVASFERMEDALELRRAILRSPLQPLAIDLLDQAAARILGCEPGSLRSSPYSLLVKVGGVDQVIERSLRELGRLAEGARARVAVTLEGDEESRLWEGVQEFVSALRARAPALTMIKAALPLAQLGGFLLRAQEIAGQHGLESATVARAGNGIAYVSLFGKDLSEDTLARLTQAAIEMIHAGTSLGGRVTLGWCPTAIKRDVNVWGTLGDDLPLLRKLKAALDPDRVLNSGRFLGGI